MRPRSSTRKQLVGPSGGMKEKPEMLERDLRLRQVRGHHGKLWENTYGRTTAMASSLTSSRTSGSDQTEMMKTKMMEKGRNAPPLIDIRH